MSIYSSAEGILKAPKLLVVLIIFFLPLPFGSARPVWQSFWISLIGITGLIAAVALTRERSESRSISAFLGLLYCLFFGFLIIYFLVPAIVGLFDLQTGEAFALGSLTVEVNRFSKTDLFYSAILLAHLCFFSLCTLTICNLNNKVSFLKYIYITGLAYSCYGLTVYLFFNNSHILWFPKWVGLDSLSSTFVNRNNFSAYLGLCINCFVALKAYQFLGNNSENTLKIAAHESSVTQGIMGILVLTIFLSTFVLTGSRGGVLSLGIGLSIGAFVYIKLGGQLSKRVTFLFVLILIFSFFVGGDHIWKRFNAAFHEDERLQILPSILDALSEKPFTGFGLGSFSEVFRIFRTEDVRLMFLRAHNDYIELILAVGIPASIALMFIVFFVLRRILGKPIYKEHGQIVSVALCASVTAQLSAHAFIDFPFQIPAISFYWCAILAYGCACLNLRQSSHVRKKNS